MEENYLIPQENKDSNENERLFMTSIVTGERLEDIKPGQFNIMCAPRGSGKTTWALSEEIINFAARDKKHIVYLIHTKLARDAICTAYPEITCAFTDKDMNGWFLHRHKNMWSLEEDVNKVHVMCYQTFSALICKDIEWLDDIDLIVWDEFDDIEQYYWKEVEFLKKKLPDLNEEALIATLKKVNHTSCIYVISSSSYKRRPVHIYSKMIRKYKIIRVIFVIISRYGRFPRKYTNCSSFCGCIYKIQTLLYSISIFINCTMSILYYCRQLIFKSKRYIYKTHIISTIII
jgi:hypothetical protein